MVNIHLKPPGHQTWIKNQNYTNTENFSGKSDLWEMRVNSSSGVQVATLKGVVLEVLYGCHTYTPISLLEYVVSLMDKNFTDTKSMLYTCFLHLPNFCII